MKKYLVVLILFGWLLGAPVHAGVAEDIRAGVSYKTAIAKGLRAGETIEQVLRQALFAAPKQKAAVLAAALNTAPKMADRIVRAAIGMGIHAGDMVKLAVRVLPKQSELIVAAAVDVAPAKLSQILKGAVAGGMSQASAVEAAIKQMGNLAMEGPMTAALRNNKALDAVEPELEEDAVAMPVMIVIPPSRGGDADVVSFN
ncbi:MAG: hypothetical protein OEW58_02340 [Gammaproteobacteria bacterium]|nr:hypothetical protein [Gammaproteobacteria bacterium]